MKSQRYTNEAADYLTQKEVGRRIEDLRRERGVSQRRLAKVIGLDPSALSRIESGQRGLAVGELVAISEFLGVPTDGFLRREVEAARMTTLEEFEAIIDDFFAFEAAARSAPVITARYLS